MKDRNLKRKYFIRARLNRIEMNEFTEITERENLNKSEMIRKCIRVFSSKNGLENNGIK